MSSPTENVKWKTTQVAIQAGAAFEVPVEVVEGSTVSWGFQIEGGDINFSVLFSPVGDDAVSEVVSKSRLSSGDKLIKGSVSVESRGTFFLQWDNTFSWFKGKQLLYSITLDEPISNANSQDKANSRPAPHVVLVLGAPGARKDTQCARLATDLGLGHVSAMELMTNAVDSGQGASAIHQLIDAVVSQKSPVVLVDGFPRTRDDVDGWFEAVGERCELAGVLLFDCSIEAMQTQLQTQRSDMTPAAAHNAIQEYVEDIVPVVDFFTTQSKIWRLNADQSSDKVFNSARRLLRERLRHVLDLSTTDTAAFAAANSSASVVPPGSKERGQAVVGGKAIDIPMTKPLTSIGGSSVGSENQSRSNSIGSSSGAGGGFGGVHMTLAMRSAVGAAPLRAILGTMTFGVSVSESESLEMLLNFVDSPAALAHTTGNGRHEIDTARMYGSGNVELLLNKLLNDQRAAGLRGKLFVATKANPFPVFNKNLRPNNVLSQLNESLYAMGADSVDLFYLHAPDLSTPIEATLQACQSLYEQGKFRELGLSNYPAWEVVRIYHLCKERGWILPTVYQGMYNAITRDVEPELLKACRACNIRFYAYNPLAGGLLTGRYTNETEKPTSGRFARGTEMGDKYQERYFNRSYFDGLARVKASCQRFKGEGHGTNGISMAEASLRWLSWHSALRGGLNDGVIIGASKMSHLNDNLDALTKGPLPQSIVDAFDEAWNMCRMDCPKYFRELNAPPGR